MSDKGFSDAVQAAFDGAFPELPPYNTAPMSAELSELRRESARSYRGASTFVVAAWDRISELERRAARYRLAWISARQRAADEANYATEALELRDEEIRWLKSENAELREELGEEVDGRSTGMHADVADDRIQLPLGDELRAELFDRARTSGTLAEPRESTDGTFRLESDGTDGDCFTVWRLVRSS